MTKAAPLIHCRVLMPWLWTWDGLDHMYLIEAGSLKLPSVCLATTEAGQSGVGSSTSILMPILACSGDTLADHGSHYGDPCCLIAWVPVCFGAALACLCWRSRERRQIALHGPQAPGQLLHFPGVQLLLQNLACL